MSSRFFSLRTYVQKVPRRAYHACTHSQPPKFLVAMFHKLAGIIQCTCVPLQSRRHAKPRVEKCTWPLCKRRTLIKTKTKTKTVLHCRCQYHVVSSCLVLSCLVSSRLWLWESSPAKDWKPRFGILDHGPWPVCLLACLPACLPSCTYYYYYFSACVRACVRACPIEESLCLWNNDNDMACRRRGIRKNCHVTIHVPLFFFLFFFLSFFLSFFGL
ncbi:hypothetical protein K504DRAFT_188134 [Pleomassaria siparia CBS 279.74]|uniref:Uncharacterized protein n=1 Tax=Pleomassaria siparia CBS 279.74 TaxID=1314801 RepID=A0A6G1JQR9_9PLEO|nr:hypothetical protein K504DRAFT_188134 [Pleomassaria siparia CBS 279.74]